MAAINKAFVIKNGLEVSTNLILADVTTRKVGIGTTVPQYTLHVNGGIGVTNLYVSGIATITTGIVTNLTSTNLNVTGIGTIVTGNITNLTSTNLNVTGIATIATLNATGIAVTNFTVYNNLSVGGISTFTNGPVLIGSGTSTGTASQRLQVTGGTYVSGNLGIGSTNPTSALFVVGDARVTGVITATTFSGNVNAGVGTITTLGSTSGTITNLTGTATTIGTVKIVSGIITATSGVVTYYGDGTYLTGTASSPNLQAVLNTGNTSTIGFSITGVSTLTTLNSTSGTITNISGTNLNYSGIGTITNLSGVNINVTGVVTATSFVGSGANLTGIANTANIVSTAITTGTLNVTTSAVIGTGLTLSSSGINVTGVVTATSFVGSGANLTGIANTANIVSTAITTGILNVGTGITANASGINVTGVITATSFVGSGSGLTGAGSTVFDDTTTNQEFFPLFTATTSGTITASGISTSKLTYNPSTGAMTAVDFNSTSDINLKENIHTVGNALEITEQLRGVSFDWKETGRSSYGVIAQELEAVLPELVKQGEVKSVNYNGIIGVLIEAIKELKKEIEDLKNTK